MRRDPANFAAARAKGIAATKANAAAFAAKMLPIIREIDPTGTMSAGAIARALDARGVRAARGGTWCLASVQNLLIGAGMRMPCRRNAAPR